MPSQWPTASSGRRGEGPAPAQRRARRLVPARKRRRWPLVAMAPARTCHASMTAEATAAPARSSCVPAPNPAAPMGRVAGRRCPHVCAVRRSPPLLQHSALAHATWCVDGAGVSGTLAPGDGGTPPRHAPTADGGDLDGRASRSSLAPAPNAAAPADDRHYPRRLHRGWPPRPERARARAGHSAHAATAVALGPHAPVMRRRRPAQRQRATTGLLSAEGHLQEKWPRRGPYEGARARKPNEVIRRPYPSSASKTGLGCGRDDDARSSYEAPGMIGQATTSSETPSITSVAGYGEMPKCGKLPGAPPVLTLKQRQLFIMIESSELRGSTTTLEVLWVVVPNDRISKVPGVPPDEAAGLYF
jgi:hypothetical protein